MKEETFSRELTVHGTIPAGLNGLFIRTGPNAQHKPNGGYHLCAYCRTRFDAMFGLRAYEQQADAHAIRGLHPLSVTHAPSHCASLGWPHPQRCCRQAMHRITA